MKYEIVQINKEEQWVKIKVVFDDGEKYEKRMMTSMQSEDEIHLAITQWISDYIADKKKFRTIDTDKLIGKSVTVEERDLPKTSEQAYAELQAIEAAAKAQEIKLAKERESAKPQKDNKVEGK